MTTFQPGDRVRVAEDATCPQAGCPCLDDARGKEGIVDRRLRDSGDIRFTVPTDTDPDLGYYAHGRFLTLDDPDPQEVPMPEFIDPSTLPEGWTLCELEVYGDRTFREVNPDGRYRLWTSGDTGYPLDDWRIVRAIDTTPDLPVIAFGDIKPGMMVEKRERFAIRADGLWEGYLPEFHLVSAPEPDPDAELMEAVEAALSLGHPVAPQSIRDVIALVDEHRAGGSDEQ